MSDLVNIQNQIEKLKKQADDIRSKEFDKTVAEIRAKMQAFGITVRDLTDGKKKGSKSGGKAKSAKAGGKSARSSKLKGQPIAAKYRGPNGQEWSGRGLPPKWLQDLIAQGRRKEEFAIASSVAAPVVAVNS